MNGPDPTPHHPSREPIGGLVVRQEPAPPFDNPVLLYLGRLNTPTSQQTMRDRLTFAAKVLTSGVEADPRNIAWERVTYGHLMALRAALMPRLAPASVNLTLFAVKGVLREVWRLGHMTRDQLERAVDVPLVKGSPFLRGRALRPEELAALFQSCETDLRGPLASRDRAILACMYLTGGRASEVVALDVADYDQTASALLIRQGKGRKSRRVFLTAQGVEALHAWLQVRGPAPGPLFPRLWRNGTLTLTRMGRRGLLSVLHRRAAAADIPRMGCHDLRRSMVTDLLTAGVDLHLVSQIAGHASVDTTKRYDKRPEDAQREAVTRALTLPR